MAFSNTMALPVNYHDGHRSGIYTVSQYECADTLTVHNAEVEIRV